jgi:hypothetical protein
VLGEPPPPTAKVCINHLGGFRNSMTFVLTGLDIEEKARLAEETLWELLGGKQRFAEAHVSLRRGDRPDPRSNEQAFAFLTIAVKDSDPKKVGRAFSSKAVEMALASYPGFTMTSPPGKETPFGVYWPALVAADAVEQRVAIGGEILSIAPTAVPADFRAPAAVAQPTGSVPGAPTRESPLGAICGARSGDKGGNANVGVWARSADAYRWLDDFLSVERLRALLPEARELDVDRFAFPNLLAINFVVKGLLGDGVAASLRSDPQAKSLGEYLRAKLVPIPISLLEGG